MSVAFVNYIQFIERFTGNPIGTRFQNFFMGRTIDFLPFGYGFGGGQSAGDRSQGSLVTPVNEISLNLMQAALDNRYLLRADTYNVDIETLTEIGMIYSDLWTIGSWSHDQVQITVELRGPGDAARGGPQRVIQQSLVGSVPSSGQLVIS